MLRVRFRFLRPICYLVIGIAMTWAAWSMKVDSIYAQLRMKMSQSAPSFVKDDSSTDSAANYLREVQECGVVLPSYGEKYGVLTSDKIGLNAPVYYGDEEEILLKGVGQYPIGKIPGMGGTYLMGGHDNTYFGCLANVEIDDFIYLSVNNLTFTYKVVGTKVMDSDQFVLEQDDEKEELLILYTCYPFDKTNSNRNQRLFVYCQMQP